jgi:hypothetical protein
MLLVKMLWDTGSALMQIIAQEMTSINIECMGKVLNKIWKSLKRESQHCIVKELGIRKRPVQQTVHELEAYCYWI